ncbi:Ribonuclease H2 subunit A [Pestalotiopsis fici W106-1]|uniref:Ribonuclease n=1 Tax=Pestalotiopsis fici (strain W106-1 / CGMCC3.15140) TaxID=1229662 RepID=W3WYL5_PESFW|nr:Ribonuclease H2 subunit A [Pestalotiopsis fici W106-1]ETS78869.1 Ribonuclease H2 subunit A [Pestalotiopsis fici W106-1]
MEDIQMTDDAPNLALETPISDVFVPPSIHRDELLCGDSYEHYSPVPPSLLASNPDTPGEPCCLGVDEAGRGPVLGPMVYGVFYLPLPLSDPLLKTTHHFDDSKVLTPAVRSDLMQTLCTSGSDLHTSCGWATSSLSARDIGAGMLRPGAAMYNLNAQAMDATISLIRGVLARGVNVREIYVDTIGQPAVYQKKLERVFPTTKITVAKKADSLYPSVSAASVCAKVTRDASLEVLYEVHGADSAQEDKEDVEEDAKVSTSKKAKKDEGMAWGSGYPSDARCVGWLRTNMHPVFGWGPECRFSWGTAKDMLDSKGGVKIEWPVDEEEGTSRMTDFFVESDSKDNDADELGTWFGTPVGQEAF